MRMMNFVKETDITLNLKSALAEMYVYKIFFCIIFPTIINDKFGSNRAGEHQASASLVFH